MMAIHRWKDIQEKHFTPEEIAENQEWARRELLEADLRTLREMAGKTQAEVAELTAMAQSELSRTERRDDHLLSTLRRYIEALGGRLEVVAVFDDKTVRL